MYEKITDPLRVRRLLRSAADSEQPAILWVEGQGFVLKSKLIGNEALSQELFFKIPGSKDITELKRILEQRKSKELFLSVTLKGKALLATKTEILDWGKGVLHLSFAQGAILLQRRKNRRWEIPHAYELMLEMRSAKLRSRWVRYRILDLSSNGYSFLVSETEKDDFVPGLLLRNSVFLIQGRKIQFDAVMKNIRKIDDPKILKMVGLTRAWRAGAQIMRMTVKENTFLTNYISEKLLQFAGAEIGNLYRREKKDF